jgi:hypothetical protein
MKDRPYAGAVIAGLTRIARKVGLSAPYTMGLLEPGRLPAALIDGVWIANAGLLAMAPRELPESMRNKGGRPRKHPLPKTVD